MKASIKSVREGNPFFGRGRGNLCGVVVNMWQRYGSKWFWTIVALLRLLIHFWNLMCPPFFPAMIVFKNTLSIK